jgi:hypothetical protein
MVRKPAGILGDRSANFANDPSVVTGLKVCATGVVAPSLMVRAAIAGILVPPEVDVD